jgi:hypothetical protein
MVASNSAELSPVSKSDLAAKLNTLYFHSLRAGNEFGGVSETIGPAGPLGELKSNSKVNVRNEEACSSNGPVTDGTPVQSIASVPR